jgi:hypothetical protein
MKRLQPSLAPLASLLALAPLLVLTGCEEDVAASENAAAPATTEAAPDAEPDLSRVTARSAERWQRVVAADWIQAYDYQHPALKKQVPIGSFLANKEHHEYRNPSKPRLIGSEGNQAFVELSVLWEPHHPILQTVENRPDDMTEELPMVETWAWTDGEWYFIQNERANEFHAKHPDLGGK